MFPASADLAAPKQSTSRRLPAHSSPPMFRVLFFRSRPRDPAEPRNGRRSKRIAETRPPHTSAGRPWSSRLGEWLGASGWRVSASDLPSSFGASSRVDAVAEARLDFADALGDVRSIGAAAAIDRIAVTRSLHELWHLRGEVFGEISCRHDQAEASRRLADLDRHFGQGRTRGRAVAGAVRQARMAER